MTKDTNTGSTGSLTPVEELSRTTTRTDLYSSMDEPNFVTKDSGKDASLASTNDSTKDNADLHRPNTISKLWSNFMDTTSAHGFYQIKLRRKRIAKVFWVFVCVLGFTGLGLHLSTMVTKYLSYAHDEKTGVVAGSPEFPDVTICNMDAISADRFVFAVFK